MASGRGAAPGPSPSAVEHGLGSSQPLPTKKLFGRAFSELSPLNPKVVVQSNHHNYHHLIFPNWSIFRHVRSSSVQVWLHLGLCVVVIRGLSLGWRRGKVIIRDYTKWSVCYQRLYAFVWLEVMWSWRKDSWPSADDCSAMSNVIYIIAS